MVKKPFTSHISYTGRDIRDMGSIPGSGRPPGGGNGNPLQYSCLENPLDRGAWEATWGLKEWDRLSDFTFTFTHLSGSSPNTQLIPNMFKKGNS